MLAYMPPYMAILVGKGGPVSGWVWQSQRSLVTGMSCLQWEGSRNRTSNT